MAPGAIGRFVDDDDHEAREARRGQRDALVEALRAKAPPKQKRAPRRAFKNLTTTGAVVVRGSEPKGCRAPEPKTAEWRRLANYAKDVLADHGLPLGDKLGCGSWGCAYRVDGKPLVVKITGDHTEAAAVRRVLEAVENGEVTWDALEAVNRTHAVYGVLDFCDQRLPIYVVVQDQLVEPVSKAVSAWFASPWSSKKKRPEVWENILAAAAGGSTGRKLRREVVERAEADLGEGANVGRLIDSVKLLLDIDVDWHDLHGGNVMIDHKGYWRIIDLGFSRSPDGVVPTLGGKND